MAQKKSITIQELPSDFTPDRLSPALFEMPYFFLLESSLPGRRGRYTIAGVNPLTVYEAKNPGDDPFSFLKQKLAKGPVVEGLEDLPFAGGWVGFLGYELYSLLEQKIVPREPDLIPRAVFGFYDHFYVYDHEKSEAKVVSIDLGQGAWGLLEGPRTCLSPSIKNINLGEFRRTWKEAPGSLPAVKSNFSQNSYLSTIQRIKNYITAGDCYQVNLAQRFSCAAPDSPYEIYQRLRAVSPSPFAAFLNLGGAQILSSSPESFLEVNGREVLSHPIKGTRPRGKTLEEDLNLKGELEACPKDRAELLMITDLLRNDLGRVCEPGSISVPDLRTVETYPQVHHLVATIKGRLAVGQDVIDLLKATFPGGSITGAPKVRAMQIIRELEPDPRNVYCGAIGLISLNQKACFNVAIRTMILKDHQATFWAGGGIVADSDPEAEYQETLVKAEGMRRALVH